MKYWIKRIFYLIANNQLFRVIGAYKKAKKRKYRKRSFRLLLLNP